MDAISLPAEASCYYSVCGSRPGLRGALILDGDALIVFGDERLARLQEGDRVSASVYELCCGPPLVTFPVTVLELASDEVGLSVFADVIGHRQLNFNYEHAEATRRLLALQTLRLHPQRRRHDPAHRTVAGRAPRPAPTCRGAAHRRR